jgi:hypothetical protein
MGIGRVNAQALLQNIRLQNIRLFVANGRIRGRGPKLGAAFLCELMGGTKPNDQRARRRGATKLPICGCFVAGLGAPKLPPT